MRLACCLLVVGCWTGTASPPPTTSIAPIEPACFEPVLYVRHEASPRSPEFDAAAKAFDQATLDYEQKRYLDAARGFARAAESFEQADDPQDRKWATGNATSARAMAGRKPGLRCSP